MGRITNRSFEEVIESTLQRNRAGLARFGGTHPGVEKPRDVFLAACARIAEALASDGFRFMRSKRELRREAGEFVHRIILRADRDNVAGRHVGLGIDVGVSCRRLEAWRRQQQHPLSGTGDRLAFGPICNIEANYLTIAWELADPADRQATVADAVSMIRTEALQWFKHFEDPAALLADFEDQWPVPLCRFDCQLDFAFCFGGRDSAQRVLTRHIASHPDLHDSIRRALAAMRSEGLDDYFGGKFNGEAVAKAHLAYGLAIDSV